MVSYLVSVLQQTQMKVDWFGFERNVLWNGVFYQWYHAVRGVVGKKKQITCSGRQTIEICPEIFFSKAEYPGKCE